MELIFLNEKQKPSILKLGRWASWNLGTVMGHRWSTDDTESSQRRYWKSEGNPGSKDFQDSFATDFKTGRVSTLQQSFSSLSTVYVLEINRKFPRLVFLGFEWEPEIAKTPNNGTWAWFPQCETSTPRHNIVNDKWLRHNSEQNFHAEILDAVLTKPLQTFYWFAKPHK